MCVLWNSVHSVIGNKGKIRISLVWTLTGQFLLQLKSNECLPTKRNQSFLDICGWGWHETCLCIWRRRLLVRKSFSLSCAAVPAKGGKREKCTCNVMFENRNYWRESGPQSKYISSVGVNIQLNTSSAVRFQFWFLSICLFVNKHLIIDDLTNFNLCSE